MLDNRLDVTASAEIAREEEWSRKKNAVELFDRINDAGECNTVVVQAALRVRFIGQLIQYYI